ncbi:MAG: TlpA family protein disulfide reductase [Thermoanaerobaculia bacterium]
MTISSASRVRLGAAVLALALLPLLPGSVRAEDVNLSCLGGGHLSDADLGRGATIVVVWASWSPRSRDIAERVGPLAARWSGSARVVTVNFQEDGAAVQRFLAGKSLGAAVCLDPEGAFSRKYNVATLPGMVVIKDGQAGYHGKMPDDPDAVIAPLLH